ncbi:Mitochondrial pyruvate carrier 1 [Quillaja saponaria]|uniref:Mitochondrial pyruvate carrier 1 n=1 Tax=Quillaja saponaria TaxID=32244 RepID=A0AAD7P5J8_QUISA|nr:Mitochondrial pyruvate carrier 1 [Quillaja saponaria]
MIKTLPLIFSKHSHCGFLITCVIKREKSATKEAISILEKFSGPIVAGGHGTLAKNENKIGTKRRKICTEDIDGENLEGRERNAATNYLKDEMKPDTGIDRAPGLSLVKLTRSGLLLFTFPRTKSPDTVAIVSNIIQSLQSGSSSSLIWCHRVFPIQATCCLNEKELWTVVSNLVQKFVNDKKNQLGRPVKFAVGYNRRGIEDTELKIRKDNSEGASSLPLLDRNKCFGIVAAAVKDAVEDSVVDLKSPELSVLVELLPVSGIPKESLVVAVSVLPGNLVSTKPRLCIKALVSNTKEGTGLP